MFPPFVAGAALALDLAVLDIRIEDPEEVPFALLQAVEAINRGETPDLPPEELDAWIEGFCCIADRRDPDEEEEPDRELEEPEEDGIAFPRLYGRADEDLPLLPSPPRISCFE